MKARIPRKLSEQPVPNSTEQTCKIWALRHFIGLFLVLAFAACLDSPSSPPGATEEPPVSEEPVEQPLEPVASEISLDEYLGICAPPALEEGGFPAAVTEHNKNMEAVDPPEEVADWHVAVLAYQTDLKAGLDAGPEEGQSEDEFLLGLLFSLALDHQSNLGQAVTGMDQGVLARMVEAGCIDADLLELSGIENPVEGVDTGGIVTDFVSVSAGDDHTCGVGVDGSVACWGDDFFDQTVPPSGPFVAVAAGWNFTCGIRTDGTAVCWGGGDGAPETMPPGGKFVDISAGRGFACGLLSSGAVSCWGDDDEGQTEAPEGEFVSVSVGSSHACGVQANGSLVCWGSDFLGKATPPEGQFVSVAAAFAHSCGVRADGPVACWGQNLSGEAEPPEGQYVFVSAGYRHTCGLKTDGSVACWGDNGDGQTEAPDGTYVAITSGSYHNCGVRENASVACWGADSRGQSSPPE